MSNGNDFNQRNIAEFRANHGRVSGPFEGAPVVLLQTVGARSGKPRTNIMMYLADGERYLVFASNAGADDNPAWYWNLKANPDARIEVGDDIVDVHATELQGAERDDKYALQAERYPGFAEYERMTSRTIPVVALTPTGGAKPRRMKAGDRRDGAVRPSRRDGPRRPWNRRPRRRPRSGQALGIDGLAEALLEVEFAHLGKRWLGHHKHDRSTKSRSAVVGMTRNVRAQLGKPIHARSGGMTAGRLLKLGQWSPPPISAAPRLPAVRSARPVATTECRHALPHTAFSAPPAPGPPAARAP
jgi:deazaflavin-dependent oxidoreductase (nitroreductase family)